MENAIAYEGEVVPKKSRAHYWLLACIVLVLILKEVVSFGLAPADFPSKSFLKIKSGETLGQIAQEAENTHLVRSAQVLKAFMELSGGDRHVVTGDYYFAQPIPVWSIALRLRTGNFAIEPVRVTLTEGSTRMQMATILAKDLTYFNKETFLTETKDKEGMLFPDTYFISPAADTSEVITLLENNYETKITPLQKQIAASGMSEHDVITLASIVEKEAFGDIDRPVIAGILFNRLNKGIRLQVDAPFLYILHQDGSDVRAADLKIDSPYNTYMHAGLPPGPIGSPGESSIRAVLNPTKTDYLFYLHDKSGGVHYAKTFAEHQKNIQTYLRK